MTSAEWVKRAVQSQLANDEPVLAVVLAAIDCAEDVQASGHQRRVSWNAYRAALARLEEK